MSINIRHVGDALIRFVKKKLEFTVVRRAQYLYYKHEQEHGYRIDKNADIVFLDTLRRINSGLEEPYFVTGQSGYFTERIEREGLGDLTLEKEDQEIVDFIIDCFHHRHDMKFKASSIPFFSSTLMGTVEYNYGTQSFPAE